ncbi:MAG: glycine cleavage system protein H [Thermodesulfobacteriota bacterium]|nr:glycine cleavage system protein H [Thermodesulfobacteriota bacterium]
MKKSNTKGFKVKGFQVVENECIWMKAGIVNFHICDNAYDCNDCKFDKAMTIALSKKDITRAGAGAGWSVTLKEKYDGSSRPCRHVITGRIQQPKICTHNYECHDCAFDQMLDNIETSEARPQSEFLKASGYDLAKDYYYHDGHTWVRVEHGGMARIGFDDFIMRLFGKAELSKNLLTLGSRINKGEAGWSIIQNNNEAKITSPLTGTIISVNQRVKENPNIMHTDPYQNGWLYIVEPDSPKKDLADLYFGEESTSWMDQESGKLMKLMGPEYENLAATGGEPVKDFFGFNPEIGWDKLVNTFLK